MKYKKLTQNYRKDETDSGAIWALSYGDMVTLLLTFYILFFAISSSKEARKVLEESLIAALNLKTSKIEATVHKKELPESSKVFAKVESEKIIIPDSFSEMNIKLFKLANRLYVTFPGISFFDSAQINITEEGKWQLKNFVDNFLPFAGRYFLEIRAFTDPRPLKSFSRLKDNAELSAIRAVSTMRVLQKLGIPVNRMKLSGYGEIEEKEFSKDIDTEQALALSRKVILVIAPDYEE